MDRTVNPNGLTDKRMNGSHDHVCARVLGLRSGCYGNKDRLAGASPAEPPCSRLLNHQLPACLRCFWGGFAKLLFQDLIFGVNNSSRQRLEAPAGGSEQLKVELEVSGDSHSGAWLEG